MFNSPLCRNSLLYSFGLLQIILFVLQVGRKIRVESSGASNLDQIGFSQRFATSTRLSDDETAESEISNPMPGQCITLFKWYPK